MCLSVLDMDCVSFLLSSVHTECVSGVGGKALSKTEQVMGVEWVNRQEDWKRCKTGDRAEKQRQQGSSPEIEYQHPATATAPAYI